jgi:uroporphyrin-3 C-methyltransferase
MGGNERFNMSEQQQSAENTSRAENGTPPHAVKNAPRHNPLASAISKMNLTQMTLAVLVVIFLWQWLDGHRAINDMQQQLAKKIAEMDGSSKANQVLLSQNQAEVRELSAKMALLETRYAEAQNQRVALEALYADLSVSRDETALAEVEQMLLIAGQQLQLSANVKAALIAMQSADARLQRMDRPAFGGLRKAIGQDMDKLRALPNVDVAAISVRLDNLMEAADSLPLAYQQRAAERVAVPSAPPKGETVWQKLLREIWQDAKQLVRIENTGKAEIPLLPPRQEFFLRENIKLHLLLARIALLSHDEASFRQELKLVQLWTTRHFDSKSDEGARMLSGLNKLAASNIHLELPDISTSLQAVRNYRLMQEKAAR